MSTGFDDLYQRDFFLWAKAQAEALRARGRGANAIDYDRLAEEVEDLGKSEFREAKSFVLLIVQHLFKIAWSKRVEPVAGWRSEIVTFRAQAADALTPTIRRMIESDLAKVHEAAGKAVAIQFAQQEPDAPRDVSLRWSLAQILGEADDPIEAG